MRNLSKSFVALCLLGLSLVVQRWIQLPEDIQASDALDKIEVAGTGTGTTIIH